jgi:hypothetical protein
VSFSNCDKRLNHLALPKKLEKLQLFNELVSEGVEIENSVSLAGDFQTQF